MLAMCLLRVELHDTKVEIELNNEGLLKALDNKNNFSVSSANLVIQCPAMKVRRGQELRLVIPPSYSNDLPAPRDDKLIALITESRATLDLILKNPNKSLPALASEHRRCRIRMAKLAKLACLAPDILTMILNGKQPVNLTPRRLLNADLPLVWDEQKRVLGFA
jgi:site-specific DNA recombinase